MRNVFCIIVLLPALLFSATPSFGAMRLHVTAEDNGKFILDGDNVKGVEAVDITINYDSTFLANTRVEVQGGLLTDVSAHSPGALTVKIFRPDPDMMFQLQLTFDKRGDSPGGLKEVAATVTDTSGKSYQAPTDIFHLTPSQPEGQATSSDGEGAAGSSAHGTAFLTKREKSVLDRFEEFRGTKGIKEFSALFERRDREGVAQDATCIGSQCQILFERLDVGEIAQEPAIALADGETPVMIRLALRPEEDDPPVFALTGAKLVSLQKSGEKSWVIRAVPDKGKAEADFIVRLGGKTLEFPLVVAPPVYVQDGVTEGGFLVALDRYLYGQAAECRMKGRPFRQFLHEYIFTANYLAKRSSTVFKGAGRL